ncbi:rhodanese-like domain-containing protein [Desulfogranum marinum]|jgi:rhodanese-related sulfurtransferase|uniref:rhodanese-like domain-containing protein n=1 Tax=Desulfogranum marinum TaxID=453220 RepID=UPI0029C6D50A|nr:rhodanese-like domain-containing protein [Desulfogranum marinum]
MNKVLLTVVIGIFLGTSSVAWSYDTEMAKSYEKLFTSCCGAGVGKTLHFVKPDALVKDIKAGKEIVTIDVRTPEESGLFTMTMPNSVAIPVNQLFKPENLARIPQDKTVVIICKSGARATAVGTALRHTGFDNVYILKGGMQALSSYYGAKQANTVIAAAK